MIQQGTGRNLVVPPPPPLFGARLEGARPLMKATRSISGELSAALYTTWKVRLGRSKDCRSAAVGMPSCCRMSASTFCGEKGRDVTRDEARHSGEPSGGGTHSCGSGSDGKTRDASALSAELAKLAVGRAKVVAPAESERSQEGVQREVKREAVLYVRVCRKQTSHTC